MVLLIGKRLLSLSDAGHGYQLHCTRKAALDNTHIIRPNGFLLIMDEKKEVKFAAPGGIDEESTMSRPGRPLEDEEEDRAISTLGSQSAFLSMLNMGIITR